MRIATSDPESRRRDPAPRADRITAHPCWGASGVVPASGRRANAVLESEIVHLAASVESPLTSRYGASRLNVL
jgi:hypothetical protein